MTFLIVICLCLLVAMFAFVARAHALEQEIKKVRAAAEREVAEAHTRYEGATHLAQQQYAEATQQAHQHYEAESAQRQAQADAEVAAMRAQLCSVDELVSLKEEHDSIRTLLAEAVASAEALQERVLSAREKADAEAATLGKTTRTLLAKATDQAGQIVAEAQQRAKDMGGAAFASLQQKEALEGAVEAMRNVVEGYGDRYVIPTHSLLDDLAANFAYTEAAEKLKAARDHSRRIVEQGWAAECDHADGDDQRAAIRFVVDAFNGRVDAILSRTKSSNHGTLAQEIKDAFHLVNHNGRVFNQARILPAYLDARLAELRWGVAVLELRRREREEQRAIQERIREEERARREYQRAMEDATREEEAIKRAMDKARAEAARANADQRAEFDAQLADLQRRLSEAEAKNQRALSMAQQTKAGHVYVISNLGAFGEQVFKIGMTRRLEPLDRVKELGDASVPFAFDVHAMIYSDDAPALERLLHTAFDDLRINKVNYRKEFFRVPIERLREVTAEHALDATFTLTAEAAEFRETQALERMTPEQRALYLDRANAQLDSEPWTDEDSTTR